MVATVLGKRGRAFDVHGKHDSIVLSTGQERSLTRRAEGATRVLPPRKRVNRDVSPVIFEDDALSVSKQRGLGQPIGCCSQTDELLGQGNDENLPPPADVYLNTPKAQRFKSVASLPSTPRHKIRTVSGFSTPKTVKPSHKPRDQSNIFSRARNLFTPSARASKLIGREEEREQLRSFLHSSTLPNQGGCIYVSGPPGTGKSALVHEVLEDFQKQPEARVCKLNCVTLRTTSQIYERIGADLGLNSSTDTALRRTFTSKNSKTGYLVVLDEIDSLIDEECSILYNLFEWSMWTGSSLKLIGIANALDLTDRFLPRLKARSLRPGLLPFLPYTSQQISTIITDKLRSLDHGAGNEVPCVHPAAVSLCAKKVASSSGDLRKAFALLRSALEQVEREASLNEASQSNGLSEVVNGATPTLQPSQVTISHVVKLAASIFNNGTSSRLSSLNLQQKAVLCTLTNSEQKRQNQDLLITPTKSAKKTPTVRELYSMYSALCKREDGLLQPLKDTEFRDVVASLETLGLVHEPAVRSSSLLTPTSSASRTSSRSDDRRVASNVTESELRGSLTGMGVDLLRRLLEEA